MPIPRAIRFALLPALLLWPSTASTAPQILAVLSSDGAVSLACEDGSCQADLSAFCLQRHRPAPAFGTAYEPAAAGAFTLVLTDAQGNQRRLPAAGRVTFVERRGYTAVSARLPERLLAELGAVEAAIEIGPRASLVPVPQQGDPDPLTAEEIETTVGPLRETGARLVDDSHEADAARIVGALVNRLTPESPPSATERAAVWRAVTGVDPAGAGERVGLSRARAEYAWCVGAMEAGREFDLRGCLERRHDRLMRDLNDGYWDAFAGS